jgi:hypothetical protein
MNSEIAEAALNATANLFSMSDETLPRIACALEDIRDHLAVIAGAVKSREPAE